MPSKSCKTIVKRGPFELTQDRDTQLITFKQGSSTYLIQSDGYSCEVEKFNLIVDNAIVYEDDERIIWQEHAASAQLPRCHRPNLSADEMPLYSVAYLSRLLEIPPALAHVEQSAVAAPVQHMEQQAVIKPTVNVAQVSSLFRTSGCAK